ncbi:MAG TPA: glycosyltransferase family 39 protein [Methylomirabilota bacterium]|nr:glycosyltransferase family 39 protein [Methylomirabilota bacterium]
MRPPAFLERPAAFLRSRADRVGGTILLAVTLATRVTYLDRPLHGDELISFGNMVLGRSFSGIVLGPFDGNSHLLNSIVMKLVYLGFGENPTLMRLPNLIMAAAAVILLYAVGSRLLGRAAGFAAALLLSLHPAMVLYSVFCRGYAGVVLFTVLSSVLLLGLLERFSWPRWVACALAGVLACAFHLFAVNVLIAQILVVALAAVRPTTEGARPLGRVALAPAVALAATVLISLPAFLHEAASGASFRFQAEFPAALLNFLGGHSYRSQLDLPSLLLALLAAAGFAGIAGHATLRRYAGLLFLSPAALYVLSYAAPVFTLHPRFFSFLLPFFCLLLAAGLQLAVGFVDASTTVGSAARPVIRIAAAGIVLLVALTFADRVRIPRKDPLVRAREEVRAFIDARPDARLLTNDTGFVRLRLRQEDTMDRIRPAPGVKQIRAALAERPAGEVFFIYVPQKRFTESDLIHYQRNVAPEVLYRRDDWLRGYLERNATLAVDLGPTVRIYDLRAEPQQPQATASPVADRSD